MDYYGLIADLVIALVSGIIGVFLGHLLSMRRFKQKDFLPPMRKLYGILCKIMDKTEAQKLNYMYERLIETTIEEKKRELALRDLNLKDSEFRFVLGPLPMAQINFLHSYRSLIGVVKECRIFVAEYSKFEDKGLIQSLKKHHKKLYRLLWEFHTYANVIVKHTKELGDITKAFEVEDDQGLAIIKKENFEILNNLSGPVSNLFRFGSQLQKQLEKVI